MSLVSPGLLVMVRFINCMACCKGFGGYICVSTWESLSGAVVAFHTFVKGWMFSLIVFPMIINIWYRLSFWKKKKNFFKLVEYEFLGKPYLVGIPRHCCFSSFFLGLFRTAIHYQLQHFVTKTMPLDIAREQLTSIPHLSRPLAKLDFVSLTEVDVKKNILDKN